ncbi:MAG: 4Fe-4S dicluster domain-containing protein [Deltaproteobacteria bacterium]|nr:4Fe-4S dicluster domain-containing protein [Deltaproteobacteria bacterium]
MDVKRRKFLKIAGLSAVAGLAAPSAFNLLLNKGEALATEGRSGAKSEAHGEKSGETSRQYGMVIDLERLQRSPGLAEKCIHACNTEHNIPQYNNPKDEIKWIWLDDYRHSFPEHSQYKKNTALAKLPVVLLCNHCAHPPCVRACPTKATFKNSDGVVMMDYHRCIGCRFCMAACPYGARSFNWRRPREKDANGKYKFFPDGVNPEFPMRMRGVVEKCNFCAKRTLAGRLPACVEACGDSKALVFGDINDPKSEISQVLKAKYTIQRKPAAGTEPSVFYII